MTVPALVELAIGLSFLYMMLAILSSSLLEYIAQKRNWRGQCMREGLRRLIEDRWIYMAVIRHPIVASLYREETGRVPPPSYMPPESFADALLDVLLKKAIDLDQQSGLDPNTGQKLDAYHKAALICADAGYAVAGAVLPLLTQAQSLEDAKLSLGKWYDTTMSRVSGSYKRATQRRLFRFGKLIVFLLIVFSIAITVQMLKSPTTRTAMADIATTSLCGPGSDTSNCIPPPSTVPADLQEVKTMVTGTQTELGRLAETGIPLGYACLGGVTATPDVMKEDMGTTWDACWADWTEAFRWQNSVALILHVVGWIITAAAISFGAEFWFAFATKFINLRSSGPKPKPAVEGAN